MGVTQPLRDEHRELWPRVESLRAIAQASGRDGPPPLGALDDAIALLNDHLIPHAQAEDAAVYPTVERLMQAPGATATMNRDHLEVVTLTRELTRLRADLSDPPTDDQRMELQRILYGLYAIIRLHFAKEEEIYLPLLDARLLPEDAAAMFQAMHDAAKHALATVR